MTADEARRSAKRLIKLRVLLEKSMATAKRKRTGRPSERAMSLASYAMDIDAVQNAVDLMMKTYHIKLGDI